MARTDSESVKPMPMPKPSSKDRPTLLELGNMLSKRHWIPIVVVLLAAAAGCKKSEPPKPGKWVECTCPYLTDFDDVAKHSLEVCVPEGMKAEKAAFGCASKMTHGPAEPCTCGQPKGPCEVAEDCKSNEYK